MESVSIDGIFKRGKNDRHRGVKRLVLIFFWPTEPAEPTPALRMCAKHFVHKENQVFATSAKLLATSPSGLEQYQGWQLPLPHGDFPAT